MLSPLIAAAALTLGLQDPVQTPPPPAEAPAASSPATPADDAPPAPEDTGLLTWDDLPEALRVEVETKLNKPPAQAVLMVEAAVAPDTDFRTVDHGDVLSEQTVRPAAFATIVAPARNGRKYGPAGAVLWAGINEDGDWWCWRNGDRYPTWFMPSDIYCYRDTDNDGDFDVTMENSMPETGLGQSRFQFTTLGRDERLRDVVTYAPGGQADFVEKVVLRYDGPAEARVAPDGRLVDGVVLFRLLTGPARPVPVSEGNALVRIERAAGGDGLDEVARIAVPLDAEGRGRVTDPRGISIEVDRVDLDGRASVKLTSGLPAGRTLLLPPPTRDDFLAMVNRMIGRSPA
ncbi:hypothetical protein [Brevundimonas subvibrioides]|uniref:Uncharacterized protein n=1 Tax=Brevundimonas subvibrioides (strain ATCC 15264 / DSM 4735 / LMG 14903 / NBRC 16000 / CB 81) TaxID=633149 RepID=D9QM56_BRESC|nr:hypothetical protein [Brevundimonas subvibrioides]ADL01982.1 hypothetical protein Bresu_2675 [Brevundimonas subvibrioides ATCC 15264]